MTWNNKPYGSTGKGDRNRSDRERVSKGMERIQNNNTEWKSCGGCKHFLNGFDVLHNTLCSKVKGFNLNNGVECMDWEKK